MKKNYIFLFILIVFFINGCCSKTRVASKRSKSKIKHSDYINYDKEKNKVDSLGQSNESLVINKNEKSAKTPQSSVQTRKVLSKINKNMSSIKKNKNTAMGMVGKKW